MSGLEIQYFGSIKTDMATFFSFHIINLWGFEMNWTECEKFEIQNSIFMIIIIFSKILQLHVYD